MASVKPEFPAPAIQDIQGSIKFERGDIWAIWCWRKIVVYMIEDIALS
jgi:hypothetical protein